MSDKKSIYLSVILIVIIGIAAYANSINGKFLWDDRDLITNNQYIKSWSNLDKIFSTNIFDGVGRLTNSYRPMQMLSIMLDYSLRGPSPKIFHLTNIFLHILVALAIFWLIQIMFKDKILAFITGALFISHPVHTTAVAYISGRADPLAAFFILLAFIFYIKSCASKRLLHTVLVALSFILALLSRENSLILPVLLLLYNLSFREKVNLKSFLSVIAIIFAYIFLREIILELALPKTEILYSTTFFERLPGFFVAVATYIRILIFPFSLHVEYGNPTFSYLNIRAIAGLLMLSALIFLVIKMRSKKVVFFSILWFLIALFPNSNLYPINAFMSENWLYLPSFGFFLLIAAGIKYIYDKGEDLRILALSIALGLTVVYSFLTVIQNNYWRQPIALYQRTIKFSPHSYKAFNNLGAAYFANKDYERSLYYYLKAAKIDPKQVLIYDNLAAVYKAIGEKEKALGMYRKATEVDEGYVQGYQDAASLLMDMGRIGEAVFPLKKITVAQPNNALARNNLGYAYYHSGKFSEAIAEFKSAVQINPGYTQAYYNLGLAYFDLGNRKESIVAYEKAIALQPDYPVAHNNLAVSYYYENEPAKAIAHCDKAIQLGYQVSPEFLRLLQSFRNIRPKQ